MDFSIKGCDWSKGEAKGFLTGKSDCIVLGIFEAQTLSARRSISTRPPRGWFRA